MSRNHRAAIVLTILVTGCSETPGDADTAPAVQKTRRAVSYFSKQYVTVPAYWYPSQNDFAVLSNWDNHNQYGAIKSAVVNLGCETEGQWVNGSCAPVRAGQRTVAGGPGSVYDPDLATKQSQLAAQINNLHAAGIQVYGYVDFYANRPPGDTSVDVGYGWWQMQNTYNVWLDGIFYDDADRNSSAGVARAEYFTWLAVGAAYINYTANLIQSARVIFNYGTTHPWTGDFVGCLANYNGQVPSFNWFLTQEADFNTYTTGIDVWGKFYPDGDAYWMNGYMPDHFINVVHDVPANVAQDSVNDLINDSRILNAGQLYITNGSACSTCNTYGFLAQNTVMNPGAVPIFDYIYNADVAETAEYAHGGASDPPPPGNCPPMDEYAAE